MNAKLFFVSLLATAFFSCCSSDDPVISPDGGDAAGAPQFLTVNLVTTGTASSRAQYENQDPEEKATYEDGSEEENAVKTVRFYFFDDNGGAVNVKKNDAGNLVNYCDWTPGATETNDESPNVEKIYAATLVLQSPNGDVTNSAKKMVAIINPTSTILGKDVTNVSVLEGVYEDYVANITTEDGGFVMSNSAYKDNDNTLKMAVSVDGKIFKEKAKALAEPVKVYVERTMAKVRVGSSLTKATGVTGDLYDPSSKKEDATATEKNQEFNKDKIYVKFLGWNTTTKIAYSRLIKSIYAWDDGILTDKFGPWSWSAFHRSFWAYNYVPEDNGEKSYSWGKFTANKDDLTIANANSANYKKINGTDEVYLNENASDVTNCGPNDTENWCQKPSQVIIAAQLVDSKGVAMEFAEYSDTRYKIDDLLNIFANNCGIYQKITTTTDGSSVTEYEKIKASDIEFVTAESVGMASQTQKGRYKVYVQLTESAKESLKENLYASNSKDAVKLSVADANKKLIELGSAKVWKNGMTYYYFDINHVDPTATDAKTIPGVVRNHIYDATVTSLVGLGTPVYDPDRTIYPEHPDNETDTYLAARINILSWRVVKNDVPLEW